MSIKLFTDLNAEWSRTVTKRRTRESLERWREIEAALTGFGDLEAIVAHAHGADHPSRDQAMGALIRLGVDDRLAWRTVLQVVMPGLVRMTRQFVPGPHCVDEVAATVVAIAWRRIAEFPLDRRPRNIGGNVVLDTRQHASATLFRNKGVEIPDADLVTHCPVGAPPVDYAVELLRLLDHAVKREALTADDARLVALTRIRDVPMRDLAHERGVLPHSLRRRRLRIEEALCLGS